MPATRSLGGLRPLLTVLLAVAGLALFAQPANSRLVAKSYSSYLNQTRPVLQQWWPALEHYYGNDAHILLEPTAANTENAAELQQLLNQWWNALEHYQGAHFLIEPTAQQTDSTVDLHQLLNQWQNALEHFRGGHFLLEPPGPYTTVPTKTGKFELKPKRTEVRPGEQIDYAIDWTVPRPNNWHDLRTIDLRACGKDAAVWIRWEELLNTVSLRKRNGRSAGEGTIGDDRRLQSSKVVVDLEQSSVTGSGETGRSVTLDLNLAFRSAARGLECDVELAARDDLGNRDGFERAGKVKVGSG